METSMRRVLLACTACCAGIVFAAADGLPGRMPAGAVPGVYRDDADYLVRKFRSDVTDPATGRTYVQLSNDVVRLAAAWEKDEDWKVVKARLFAYCLDNMSIDVSDHDWFPASTSWSRYGRVMNKMLWARADRFDAGSAAMREIRAGNRRGDWSCWHDFDHSVPDWDAIIPLGFTGLRARLLRYRKDTPFYRGLEITADAILRGIGRYEALARRKLAAGLYDPAKRARMEKEIASLHRLRTAAPQSAYDVMQFIYIYWVFCEQYDNFQVRSLSNIDRILTPYYDADIAAARTTEREFREHFRHFLWQWGSIDNYWGQPIYMGGTRADGSSEYNHLSKIILEVMDEEALPTPKLQLKIADNTPPWVLDKALDMVRRHRSLVFCGEKSMMRVSKADAPEATDEDLRQLIVAGCYEFGFRDGYNGTGIGHVNTLKPIECMLREVRDGTLPAPPDFEAFTREYLRRLAAVSTRCRELACEGERHLAAINPADMFSLATEHAVKTGRDAFAEGGCRRGNGSTILQTGLGTSVDALMAVKELVYENGMSLKALGEIMARNWAGEEALRTRMLRAKRKWGNNDPEANRLGGEIARTMSGAINGHPNLKGGRFSLSGHCAKQFIDLGRKTGATPDGRRAGDEMSKNLSPAMGADTEGVTALIATLGTLDARDFPGDFPLDVMLHPATVSGEKGLGVLRTILRTYFDNGGCAIHFNIVDAAELRDAQRHPEKYENLQVRVCGWNVRWNDLPRREQDEYIRRAEAMPE